MIYNKTMKWSIELFEKANHECPVLDFIQSLPPKHRAKIEREIDLLEEFGINKTPLKELEIAKKYMQDYIRRCEQ
jgi:phage-related protein